MVNVLAVLMLVSCGQVESGDTDHTIDCIDGCSKSTPSPSPNNGCDITDIPEGAVITCNGRSVVIRDYKEEQPSLTTSPNPTSTPVNTIIIYQCKKHKHND